MGGGEIPARRIAEQAQEAAGLRFRLRSGRRRGPRTESSPDGVDERRQNLESKPTTQLHYNELRERGATIAQHARASQPAPHTSRPPGTTTIFKSHGLAEEDRTPQQRAVRVGSPAVRGPTPGHPTPRNPGQASAGASAMNHITAPRPSCNNKAVLKVSGRSAIQKSTRKFAC